ncbi:MAG TPA: DUF1801 domain-containing protein [Pyrinomonadaceae bacterium]|jgi:hypothetical protein|nr:DUF1801 domain-containing protein [Pyrinomonadaceae bacterium]
MSRHKPPAALVKFLKPYDREVQKLALAVRDLVLEEMAPCHENIYDAYSAVAIGYGPTDKLGDGVFHVAVYTKGVNLGFNHGATLDDPERILEGAGKQIRHIKIRTSADLTRPAVREYVRRARQVALDDARKLGEAVPKVAGVVSTVKAIYAKKRRPAAAKSRNG